MSEAPRPLVTLQTLTADMIRQEMRRLRAQPHPLSIEDRDRLETCRIALSQTWRGTSTQHYAKIAVVASLREREA